MAFDASFRGVLVPATTPFDPLTGEIAPVSLRENLRHWVAAGVDGVVLFGSTGEGALLDEAEKASALDRARGVLPPELPLIAGAGADATRAVIRQARTLADAGADAVIVHPPAYYGSSLSPEGMREHFIAIADGSPVPVVLYNIPRYTHVTIEAGLVRELSRHDNIAAIKDSSGDLRRLGEFADACGAACGVFAGNGTLLLAALEMGACGGILAVGLLAPRECARILQWHGAGRLADAGRLQEKIDPVHREVVARLGVPGVKFALDLLGRVGGEPRSPLRPLRERERAQVADVLRDAGLLDGGT